ncbi:DUF4181 domain-containing protein [Cytobacillus firmus]|uniref:DUF4181 domain-containing protein n=1 Tax=Cytobacillus firmus TaxID=1399 RepID=UPI0021AD50E2|nr:DUF4181 domain-containing protein [Cytobacillus firmus]
MHIIDPVFWPKLLLLITIVGALMYFFELSLRKRLKVEKKNFFSNYHINDKHKKVDWTIRISFLVILLNGAGINIERDPLESLWFLEPWFLLIVIIVTTEMGRAFMEWKYTENRKAFVVTICQLVFILIVFSQL